MNPMKFLPAVLAMLLLLLASGCREQPARPASAEIVADADGTNAVDEIGDALEAQFAERRRSGPKPRPKPKAAVAAAPVRQPAADQQWCFQCAAKGTVACRAEGCTNGYLPCSGPCVRPGKGTWVPSPSRPGELGFKMPVGNRRSAIITMNHIGEVWVAKNGEAVSLGACPTCRGQTRVACRQCSETGQVKCDVCQGDPIIPAAWKPTDNPWFNAQPDVVRLKGGRVFLGREAGGDGETVLFRTRAGEVIKVPKAEVVTPAP